MIMPCKLNINAETRLYTTLLSGQRFPGALVALETALLAALSRVKSLCILSDSAVSV